MGDRLMGQEFGMAGKRPVLAIAVAGTVVVIGFLAIRPTNHDHSVVTKAGGAATSAPNLQAVPAPGATANADPTLVSAGRPAPDGPRPKEIAAIEGGAVVLLNAADGHVTRTLVDHPEAATGGYPYLEGLSLSPDRRQVFYALAGDCGPAQIFRVATDGRTPAQPVLTGVSPAVSPDGRKLAYAVASPGPALAPLADAPAPTERHCQNAVVVRDLDTGAERTWRYPDTPDYATTLYRNAVISEIAWAPDSTRLAYTLSYEGDSISVLDTEKNTDLSQTLEVVLPDGGGNSSHPAWQATTGQLGLFNTRFECCYDDDYTGPPRALLVDPDRRIDSALLPPGRRVTALDFDASGAHLLFVDGGRLYRRSGTQTPVALTTGVTHADW